MNGISLMIVWFGAKNIDNGIMQVGDMMAIIQYTMQNCNGVLNDFYGFNYASKSSNFCK